MQQHNLKTFEIFYSKNVFLFISATSHENTSNCVIHKINLSLNPIDINWLSVYVVFEISMKHLLEIINKSRNTTIHWLVVHQSLSYTLSCNTNISQHYHTHFNATPHTSQHYHAKKLYKSKSICCLHKWWLLDLSNKAGQLGKKLIHHRDVHKILKPCKQQIHRVNPGNVL